MTVIGTAVPVALVPDWSADDRKYTAYWNVFTDDATDGGPEMMTTAGLPDYGDSLSFSGQTDAYAFCIRLRSDRVEMGAPDDTHPSGVHVFRVTGEYSSRIEPPRARYVSPSTPWVGRVPQWSFPSKEYLLAVDEAHKGSYEAALEAVRNTAKQEYDPGLVTVYKNRLIHVTWWSEQVDLSACDLFQWKCNHSEFWGAPRRKLRINDVAFAVVYENGIYYSENRVEIEMCNNPRTDYIWIRRVPEIGNLIRQYNEQSEIWEWLLPEDANGQSHTERVFLNAQGGKLLEADDPIFTDWYVEDEVEFSGLNLPDFPDHVVL